MPATLNIPQITLPVGSRAFGPISVPDGDTDVLLTIDRTVPGGLNGLDATSQLEMLAEMTTDGGATWHAVDIGVPGSRTLWQAPGGVYTNSNRAGQLITATTSAGGWVMFPATGRRVRATATVSGPGPITVAGSIATT